MSENRDLTETIPVKWLKDKDDNKFFPVTHLQGVRGDNGVTLPTILGNLPNTLQQLDDTTIESVNDKDFLLYDDDTSKWENETPEIIDINEIDLPEIGIIRNAITDYDGNTYDVSIIGDQVWMVDNLKVTHYTDGTEINFGTVDSSTDGYYAYPDNSQENVETCGLLYNNAAALGMVGGSQTKQLLPDNWKVPSQYDLEQLSNMLVDETTRTVFTNELYDEFFKPIYPGYIESGTFYSFEESLLLLSTDNWALGFTDSGHIKSGSNSAAVDGGDVSSDLFCSIRGVYKYSKDVFIKKYIEENRETEGDSPIGKFLKRTENGIAWTDISYNDLKERPCYTEEKASTYELEMTDENEENGIVSFVFQPQLDSIQMENITGMTVNGTPIVLGELKEFEASGQNILYYGNAHIVDQELPDSEENFFIAYTHDILLFYGDSSIYGVNFTSAEMEYLGTVVHKLDKKYIDLELNDLSDCGVSEPNDEDFLLYRNVRSEWENVTPSINEINENTAAIYKNAMVDIDGNTYDAAIFGDYVWITSNLRTTRYTDGTDLAQIRVPVEDYDDSVGSYSFPNDDENNLEDYGLLYNIEAMTHGTEAKSGNSQKLVPNGWHMPTLDELENLYDALIINMPKSNSEEKSENNKSGNDDRSTTINPYSNVRPEYYVFNSKNTYPGSFQTSIRKAALPLGPRDFDSYLGVITTEIRQVRNMSYTGIEFRKYYQRSNSDFYVVAGYGSFQDNYMYPVRVVSDLTPQEFIAEYKRTRGTNHNSKDGKFLKHNSSSDNQSQPPISWSDISYNDLKEKPFYTEITDSPHNAHIDYDDLQNSVLYCEAYYDFEIDPTLITGVFYNGTYINPGELKYDSNREQYYFGNLHLDDLRRNNGNNHEDTGENFLICLDHGALYVYGYHSVYGDAADSVVMIYKDSEEIHKLDNKYLDLSINDLSDASTHSPAEGDFLMYNESAEEWENARPGIVSIDDDVEIYKNAVTDYDGNTYDAAIFGNRVWMVDNLRTTHFTDGTAITSGPTDDSSTASYAHPGLYEDIPDSYGYGLLYNATAIETGLGETETKAGNNNVCQLAPIGWHIPTNDDMYYLSQYLLEMENGGTVPIEPTPIKASSNPTPTIEANTNSKYKLFKPVYAGCVEEEEEVIVNVKKSGGTVEFHAEDFDNVLYIYSIYQSEPQVDRGVNEKGTDKTENLSKVSGPNNGGHLLLIFVKTYPSINGGNNGGNVSMSTSNGDFSETGSSETKRGNSKNQTRSISSDAAYMTNGFGEELGYYTVRAVCDLTPEEFIANYKAEHPVEGSNSPIGKFLKGTNEGIAWSDISYNDLKNRPFYTKEIESEYEFYYDMQNNGSESSFLYAEFFTDDYIYTDNFISIKVNGVETSMSDHPFTYYEDDDVYYSGNPHFVNSELEDNGDDFALIRYGGTDFYFTGTTNTYGETINSASYVCLEEYVKKLDSKYLDLSLGDISNVSLNNLSDGNVLQYSSHYNKWINVSNSNSMSLWNLSDTSINNLSNGQILQYDTSYSKWRNVNMPSSNSDFTHTSNTTISTSTTTVTFTASQRNSRMITISNDLDITFACNNYSDNYLWIKNASASSVDITIGGVTSNNTNVSNIYMPSDDISIPAGKVCEIGIIVNADGAFITSRNDLTL